MEKFEFVLALTNKVRKALLEEYGVDESKILKIDVSDPYGDDFGQYLECAKTIARKLGKIEFPRTNYDTQ